MFKKHKNITHTVLELPDTEKQKALKVIRKQLLIGAAAVTATVAAAIVVGKALNVDVIDAATEN